MFGYVTIRKDDLKVKDYNKYQAYYCGLCQDIKEAYGKKGQAMLTFDMTFLSILLTGLYECETKEEEHYCFLHPGKKHKCLRNKYTKYCADMNVLLAYYNLLDDWEDEKNYAAFTAAKALKKSVTRIEASYPRQTKAVQDYLEKLHACEKENNPDLDLAAGSTGEVMAEIYIPEEDIWSRRTNRSWMNASTAPRTRAEVRRMAEMLTAAMARSAASTHSAARTETAAPHGMIMEIPSRKCGCRRQPTTSTAATSARR